MNSFQSLKAVAAVAGLLLGLVTAAGAVQQQSTEEEPITLIGTVSVDGAGGYVLVEEQSGDSIALRGPSRLADFAGAFVKVSGRWVDDPDGAYFMVATIEKV